MSQFADSGSESAGGGRVGLICCVCSSACLRSLDVESGVGITDGVRVSKRGNVGGELKSLRGFMFLMWIV